jgi:hypothetical protein
MGEALYKTQIIHIDTNTKKIKRIATVLPNGLRCGQPYFTSQPDAKPNFEVPRPKKNFPQTSLLAGKMSFLVRVGRQTARYILSRFEPRSPGGMMESRDNHMTRYNVRFLAVGDGIRHGNAMTADRERAEPSARLKGGEFFV